MGTVLNSRVCNVSDNSDVNKIIGKFHEDDESLKSGINATEHFLLPVLGKWERGLS